MILKHNLRGEQSLKPFASRWVSSPSEYPWISVAHYAIPLDWRMQRHAFNWIGRRIFTGQSLSWPVLGTKWSLCEREIHFSEEYISALNSWQSLEALDQPGNSMIPQILRAFRDSTHQHVWRLCVHICSCTLYCFFNYIREMFSSFFFNISV